MEINAKGDIIATASEKVNSKKEKFYVQGTLIRLFNTSDGKLIRELRRGTEQHRILSISFSLNSDWLSCFSDSGTVHIFGLYKTIFLESLPRKPDAIKEDKEAEKEKNKKSKQFLRNFVMV